jgi:putative NIF3 family GTP cyclohydrolase 1 type 2
MRARDLHDYCQQRDGGWVDWDDTVDGFIAGDPDAAVEGIALGWMSYSSALEEAVDEGCNVFVTHEPTFFNHHDDPRPDDLPETVVQEIERKQRLLDREDLVVYRCHDLWDQLPGVGVPDAWGDRLGLGEPAAGEGYLRVFECPEPTARELAARVADRTRADGQSAVELVGPGEAAVSRVAIGTGAITPFTEMIESHDVDVAICSDDGFTYWRDGAIATDAEIPAIVVNHAVSELAGVEAMAADFDRAFDVPVHHVEQTCQYDLVGRN